MIVLIPLGGKKTNEMNQLIIKLVYAFALIIYHKIFSDRADI